MVTTQRRSSATSLLADGLQAVLSGASFPSDVGWSNNPWWQPNNNCLLKSLVPLLENQVTHSIEPTQLGHSARTQTTILVQQLRHCIDAGYTLRRYLPRVDACLQREWLGERLVWMHAAYLNDRAAWVTWVSSRLGRDGRGWQDWPVWLSQQVRHMLSAASIEHDAAVRVMLVPSTTLLPLSEPLVQQSRLPAIRIELPSRRDTTLAWLSRRIEECSQSQRLVHHRQAISLSPPLSPACSLMQGHPLQDRVAICWADRIMALSLRTGGTIDRLLRARLNDTRFPAGSVMVAMDTRRHQLSWLDRGAVGWHLVPKKSDNVCSVATCRHPKTASSLFPCIVPLHRWTSQGYLADCVRGDPGRDIASQTSYRVIDAWLCGGSQSTTAYETLLRIIDSGRLRASPQWNRSGQSTVSLSEVPLQELLARRTFQSHLGRWDWEPYGLLIKLETIQSLGGRAVMYGDDAFYSRLPWDQQPFFQPARWQSEREWRVVGDIRLFDLPANSVRLFVKTREQAEQLARVSPWTIVWV